jgi:hypothetical protein
MTGFWMGEGELATAKATATAGPPPAAKDDNQKATAKATADSDGMANKRTDNSKGKDFWAGMGRG